MFDPDYSSQEHHEYWERMATDPVFAAREQELREEVTATVIAAALFGRRRHVSAQALMAVQPLYGPTGLVHYLRMRQDRERSDWRQVGF